MSTHKGLTSAEVEERIRLGRSNRDATPSSRSYGQIIRQNLITFFNALNLALAAAVALFALRDPSLWVNIAFLGVVFWNAGLGIVQGVRAKIVVDRLNFLTQQEVWVIRDGERQQIPSTELVEDDLFVVARGDELAVDALLIETKGMELDESLLTGESKPQIKHANDPLLSGSTVLSGDGLALAKEVGLETFAKQLASEAKKEKKAKSMLVAELDRLVRGVAKLIVPLGIILLIKGILFNDELSTAEVVVTTVSNLVSMIPEGLILLTSVALAVSVLKLARRQTMAQTLTGIESLARVDVLCLDKTGTITTGEVELLNVLALEAENSDEQLLGTTDASLLGATDLAIEQSLINLAEVFNTPGVNATQRALNRYAADRRASLEASGDTVELWQIEQLIPFSSERKWSAVTFLEAGSFILGAPNMILHSDLYPSLTATIEELATEGKRVLLLARSTEAVDEAGGEEGYRLPKGMKPFALIIFGDEIRADASRTFQYFREQDVALKIISGDHPLTTASLAKRAGIEMSGEAVDCLRLDEATDFQSLAREHTIFGRVSPYQKRALIQALQDQGHQVAMVGDGVNDVLALKAANCSIAMADGSDAARSVSDLVLLDNNLASMVDAVYEGRRVINNMQRVAILFLVKTCYATIMAILMLFLPLLYPLFPVQATLINSLMVGIPSFFLALKPNRERVQGSFLANVLPSVIPPGLTIVLSWIAIQVVANLRTWSYEHISTLSLLLLAVIALLTLFRTSFPYDLGRVLIFILSAVSFVALIFLFPSLFNLLPYSWRLLRQIIPFTAAAIGLNIGLVALVDRWVKNGYWQRIMGLIRPNR